MPQNLQAKEQEIYNNGFYREYAMEAFAPLGICCLKIISLLNVIMKYGSLAGTYLM